MTSARSILNYSLAIVCGMFLGTLTSFHEQFLTIMSFCGFLVAEEIFFRVLFRKDHDELKELQSLFGDLDED